MFVSVPEQHAGKPMSIESALQRLELFEHVPGFDLVLTLKHTVSQRFGSWLLLNAALKTGGLEAFVQDASGRRFMKIPPAYWEGFNFADGQRDLFEGMADAVGYDENLIGQPVVVWEDGLTDIIEIGLRMAKVMHEDAREEGAAARAGEFEYPPLEGPFNSRSPWGEISAWYLKYIADAPPEGYTREEDERAGRSIGIGRDRIRDLRRAYKPSHWSDGGRPAAITRRKLG